MKQIDAIAAQCHYTGYMEKYVTFPPKGPLPLPGTSTSADPDCDVWSLIFDAALLVNPAFNVYRIFDTYPILWDVTGFPSVMLIHFEQVKQTNYLIHSGSFPQTQLSPLYFDRPDVKHAIHAPQNVNWTVCLFDGNVFPNGDASLPPAMSVLPSVIEKTNNTVIVHGLADYVLIADG
jgi:carboxypeptidase D